MRGVNSYMTLIGAHPPTQLMHPNQGHDSKLNSVLQNVYVHVHVHALTFYISAMYMLTLSNSAL